MKGKEQVVDIRMANLEILKDPEILAVANSDIVRNFGVLSMFEPGGARGHTALENRIQYLENAICFRNVDVMRVLDSDSAEASRFLDAVSELQLLARDLRASQSYKDGRSINVLLVRVHDILRTAMGMLEDDLVHLLKHHSQPIVSNFTSFSSENNLYDYFPVNSINEEILQGRTQRDLINPDVLPDIKRIVMLMFASELGMECCQSYITARKDALNQYLSLVFPEKMSIMEVLKMDWKPLDLKIGRWIKVLKNFVCVYLSSEKRLCKHIFGDLSKEVICKCVSESVKDSVMQLLNFAEAVASLPPSEDKLFLILDVYETLIDLHPEIEALELKDSDLCRMTECREILSRLGDGVRVIFQMLKDKIQNESSAQPPKGGYHPVTRYVMNYLQYMASYEETISLIFGSSDCEDPHTSPGCTDETTSEAPFSLSKYLVSVVSILESNLDIKSSLYHDRALQHLFMVNNISYMVKKVRENSHLMKLFGEVWVRNNIIKCKKHANLYHRTWSSILAHLTFEGAPRQNPKKLKDFNNAFEEMYRVQTDWQIPDEHLRTDLQIVLVNNVIPLYLYFLRRCRGSQSLVKYVKHSPEGLQGYLFDLFEGVPKSVSSRR